MWYDPVVNRDLVPDFLLRMAIRNINKGRLRRERRGTPEDRQRRFMELIETLKKSPIAVHTDAANQQHYEVPAEFYDLVLGPYRKYSSCYYRKGIRDLGAAESDMLELTVARAELKDGQKILELGCGWGSLTLFMAQKFPRSKITAVSNSASQKTYIMQKARERGLRNVQIITADMNNFRSAGTFDRIVSVEMLEHMRNYDKLFERISGWLKPNGKFFVHIFTHKEFAYLFEVTKESDWMPRYFFTGGIMPSNHLLLYFARNFAIEKHWVVDGTHYEKTSNDWARNLRRNRKQIMPVLTRIYGAENAVQWYVYWKLFFFAVAELFGAKKGKEWMVNHYLFTKK